MTHLPIAALSGRKLTDLTGNGFDYQLVKPFPPDEVIRWLSSLSKLDIHLASRSPVQDLPGAKAPVLQIAGDLDREDTGHSDYTRKELLAVLEKTSGDVAFLAVLLDRFVAGTQETIAQIRIAVRSGDRTGIKRWAHQLKGQFAVFNAFHAMALSDRLAQVILMIQVTIQSGYSMTWPLNPERFPSRFQLSSMMKRKNQAR